jgi:hypothetical protein
MSENFLYEYKGKMYPNYLKEGNACSYIIPFAIQFCKGKGLDIGGYLDWSFPGATSVNVTDGSGFDAYNLPGTDYDYIFSSHTLEHLPNYVSALRIWQASLKSTGTLFLYLPHPDMEYWLPQNNPRHFHVFDPEKCEKLLLDIGFKHVIRSERDLYWSFSLVAFR